MDAAGCWNTRLVILTVICLCLPYVRLSKRKNLIAVVLFRKQEDAVAAIR